jgi:hypothetical protein
MKSTKAEILQRVEAVFRLRLGGAEFSDIREYAIAPEQNWNVSDSQLWRYIRAADQLVKERFDARAQHLLNRHILQRRQLYAHAMGAGDYSTALRILDSEAKLEGLFPAEKHEHSGKDGGPIQTQTQVVLSDDQRAAAITAILARVGTAGPGPDRNGASDHP